MLIALSVACLVLYVSGWWVTFYSLNMAGEAALLAQGSAGQLSRSHKIGNALAAAAFPLFALTLATVWFRERGQRNADAENLAKLTTRSVAYEVAHMASRCRCGQQAGQHGALCPRVQPPSVKLCNCCEACRLACADKAFDEAAS